MIGVTGIPDELLKLGIEIASGNTAPRTRMAFDLSSHLVTLTPLTTGPTELAGSGGLPQRFLVSAREPNAIRCLTRVIQAAELVSLPTRLQAQHHDGGSF